MGCWCLHSITPGFFCGLWGLNSGLHVCKLNIFLVELSPQLNGCILSMSSENSTLDKKRAGMKKKRTVLGPCSGLEAAGFFPVSKHSLAHSRDNQGIVMGPDHFWKLLSHPKANHLHTFLPEAPPLSPSSLLSSCALCREPLFLARMKQPYLCSPSGTSQLFLYTFPLGGKITLTVL